jgi:twinkle protein
LETTRRLAGKVVQAPLHLPGREVAEEVKNAAYDALRGSVMFYDSFGQTEWERVRSVIRHMNKAEDIRIFYLDHLTALADTADEKGSLEQLMKEISGLAQELEIIIHCVSHLTTPEKGLPHEEGGRVMIRHFKGSRAIGFWSHQMFGIERDTQADNAEDRNTTFRILKCRQNGPANGKTIEYAYDEEKFLLVPVEAVGFEDRETVSEDF